VTPEAAIAELAGELVRRTGSSDVAFLQEGERVLYARGTEEPGSPFTATTTLVQGIHESRPELARKLVRARIWTTREPGAFAWGLVKVAARRISTVEPSSETHLPREMSFGAGELVEVRYEPREISRPSVRPRTDWLELAASLVADPDPAMPLHARDRRVGAVLVSPGGDLLAASANTNARNRTLHAELNVLTTAWLANRKKLARGTRLYVTLSPCKMCAGLAWELGEEPGAIAVFFRELDPGPAARDTVLERGTNSRRRFAKTRADLEVECLFRSDA
jgi:hypothetical protein